MLSDEQVRHFHDLFYRGKTSQEVVRELFVLPVISSEAMPPDTMLLLGAPDANCPNEATALAQMARRSGVIKGVGDGS